MSKLILTAGLFLLMSLQIVSSVRLVCYFTNWSQYRPGKGKFLPENIDPHLCTHLIYAFSAINSSNELVQNEWNDDVLYKSFNDLKNRNPNLKTQLAVGGWNFGTEKYLDFVNVKTYDFHGSTWEKVTGHHSPLYNGSHDTSGNVTLNTDFVMKYWRDKGMPVEKLNMGFATYGRAFRLSTQSSEVGAPARGSAPVGFYTRQKGFWSYYEICPFLQGASVQWIEDQKVPYAIKQNEWVGFDNTTSFEIKIRYLKDNNFGGASVWAIDLDDFKGQFCGQGNYPLISYLRDHLDFPPTPT